MCKEIIYFCAELLNYWSMTFFGLKLFAKVYGFEVHKNKTVENVIYALLCLPIGVFGAINYQYVVYSTALTYIMILYEYIILKNIFKKIKLSLVFLYISSIRLIDLWIVAVMTEVNKLSRDIYLELVSEGFDRSIYMFILVLSYYYVYKYFCEGHFINYLNYNKFYCWIMCLYSILGNGCFSRVYLIHNKENLIHYWMFYLICAFALIGFFFVYFVGIKVKENERILNMRNDMINANYLGLQKAYELNSTLQHDHKNHILAISELIKANKKNEALGYIQNYLDIGNKIINEIKSGNDIINIIVSSKLAEASEKGIKFIYEIDYLDKVAMDNIDICALLANLLDNAVESCEKIVDKDSKICLKILKKNNMLIIQIINSVHSDFFKKKHLFHTDKNNPNLHGWGIYSIEHVVKKYHGTKEYYITDEMIEIFITIPI